MRKVTLLKVYWLLLCCTSLVIVAALVTGPEAGGYSCDFKLAVMRQAAEDAISELGPKHATSFLLIQRLHDAQYRCDWQGERYRCRTP